MKCTDLWSLKLSLIFTWTEANLTQLNYTNLWRPRQRHTGVKPNKNQGGMALRVVERNNVVRKHQHFDRQMWNYYRNERNFTFTSITNCWGRQFPISIPTYLDLRNEATVRIDGEGGVGTRWMWGSARRGKRRPINRTSAHRIENWKEYSGLGIRNRNWNRLR